MHRIKTIPNPKTYTKETNHLMPATSSDAHGWCMLSAKPSSDINWSSLSWSRRVLNVDVTPSELLSPC